MSDAFMTEQEMREEIIQILLATRSLSEGVAADAILSALSRKRLKNKWSLKNEH